MSFDAKIRKAMKISFGITLMNVTLAVFKFYLAFITNSLVIFSFAFDSTLDFIANIITFISLRKSSQPPDEEHPYGHRKYQAIAQVVIVFFICFSAFQIIIEAVSKLLEGIFEASFPDSVLWAFIAILSTYFVTSITEFLMGRRLKIRLLEADALHILSDIGTTSLVLVAILFYNMGYKSVDAYGSIIIAISMVVMVLPILKESTAILVDASIVSEEMLRQIIKSTKHVLECHKIKSRWDGAKIYIEFHIRVPSNFTVKESHDITQEIEEKLGEVLGKDKIEEITIHVEPEKKYDNSP